MFHYFRLNYRIPIDLNPSRALEKIKYFIYRQLDEFKCLPRDETVNKFILSNFALGRYPPAQVNASSTRVNGES